MPYTYSKKYILIYLSVTIKNTRYIIVVTTKFYCLFVNKKKNQYIDTEKSTLNH